MSSVYNQKVLLVTDADNTLWDTDAIYAAAQLKLLATIEAVSQRNCGAHDRLAFVRRIDQGIAYRHPLHLRYPPNCLIVALSARIDGVPVETAITNALHAGEIPTENRFKAAERAFLEHTTHTVPNLRVGVTEFFQTELSKRLTVVIATEGSARRCWAILEAHGLDDRVQSIESGSKTEGLYARIAANHEDPHRVAVGDQTDRDIAGARDAGFITVLFPSAFNPEWVVNNAAQPDFTITSFAQILEIISRYQ